MFKTAVLASGSKGNSVLIKTEKTKILLDVGLSGKKILEILENLQIDEASIDAVIVSHEHSDHISGVGILCRKLKIPLFITKNTYLVAKEKLGKIPAGVIHFENNKIFRIGNLVVSPLSSSHDAEDSCNFLFSKEFYSEKKLAVATDLGFCSKLHVNMFKDVSSLILESNHDYDLLINGSYPWKLKQRIRSNQGHLSNEQAVGLLSQIIQPNLKNVVLAHISEENNCYKLVKKIFSEYFSQIRFDTNLLVSTQYKPTPLVDI